MAKTTKLKPTEIPQHYDVATAAEVLGLHHTTVRRAIWRGDLKAARIGTKLIISAEAIREFLAANAA